MKIISNFKVNRKFLIMAILVLDSPVGFHIFIDPLFIINDIINSASFDLNRLQKLKPGPNFYFESPEQAAIILDQLNKQSLLKF